MDAARKEFADTAGRRFVFPCKENSVLEGPAWVFHLLEQFFAFGDLCGLSSATERVKP